MPASEPAFEGGGTQAYVFFGDRCAEAFQQNTSYARILGVAPDILWLVDLCAPLGVDVEIRHPF